MFCFEGPPLKLSERVVRTTPLQTNAVQDLLTKLGLGVQSGLDPDSDNTVAVSTFAFGEAPTPMQVWCSHFSRYSCMSEGFYFTGLGGVWVTVLSWSKVLSCQFLASETHDLSLNGTQKLIKFKPSQSSLFSCNFNISRDSHVVMLINNEDYI